MPLLDITEGMRSFKRRLYRSNIFPTVFEDSSFKAETMLFTKDQLQQEIMAYFNTKVTPLRVKQLGQFLTLATAVPTPTAVFPTEGPITPPILMFYFIDKTAADDDELKLPSEPPVPSSSSSSSSSAR